MLRCFAVVLLSIGMGVSAAQTPITSLPRPAGDTDPVSQQPPPQQPTTLEQQTTQSPAGDVHPITSLPKPPGEETASPTVYMPPAPQPVVVPDVTSMPATPTTTPATEPAMTPAPAAQPASEPAVTYPTPTVTTSTPHDAVVPPPQPTPTPEEPLHARVGGEQVTQPVVVKENVRDEKRVHPFSTFGAQFKVGSAGIGFDVATPLAQHFNLRAGGNIFTYTGSFDDSGNHINGTAQFRSGSVYVEYFPWSRAAFHLNVGAVFDGNYMNGTSTVAAGQKFDMGDGTYYSSMSDPVHGTVQFSFGKTVAPSFTLGFGNIVPRSKKHFSFPFEVGFMYTGDSPNLQMTLIGTVCDASTPPNCQKIDNDPEAQGDLKKELDKINSDIKFLKFYPIISQGISIKF